MKNIIPVIAIATVFMASCQSNTNKTTSTQDSTLVSADPKTNGSNCYLYSKNRDTATLTIKVTDNKVSGDLSYNLFEKDKNKGTIEGIVNGDTLITDYTFQSEGATTTRQVVLLKKGDQLIEGFGDIEEVDGKTKFKNISKLKFENSILFDKIDCK